MRVKTMKHPSEGSSSPAFSRRASVLAGTWYPASAGELRGDIQSYLNSARRDMEARKLPQEKSRIVIAPHAGYCYSGQSAAYSYVALQKKGIKRVIILSPAHRVYLTGIASSSASVFTTPLGDIPLDTALCRFFEEQGITEQNDDAHRPEHAVEIHLPFVQSCFESVSLVPLVVGDLSKRARINFAKALEETVDEETALIVSSDFTHYGEAFRYLPFTDNIKENLKKLDGGAIEYIVACDADRFQAYTEENQTTICGQIPIEVVLRMKQSIRASLLHYTTSGEKTGDFSQSVSYASLAFL